jgi:hypothetical protein
LAIFNAKQSRKIVLMRRCFEAGFKNSSVERKIQLGIKDFLGTLQRSLESDLGIALQARDNDFLDDLVHDPAPPGMDAL